MSAAEPIRSKEQLKQMAEYYLEKGQIRNYALLVTGVHTALRIGDLLCLRWGDVYDFSAQNFREHISLTEQKTGKPKQIALNGQAVDALHLLFDAQNPSAGDVLFPNNRKNPTAISRVQAYRIIRNAAEALNMDGHITCHSLRKTFGYHAWKAGTSSVLLMDIYNHSNYSITRRYLGVAQDDRDQVYRELHLL